MSSMCRLFGPQPRGDWQWDACLRQLQQYHGYQRQPLLTKTGTGLLVLSGTNSYTGGTAVNAGVLTFSNTAAQPTSGTTTVAAGATLGLGVGSNPNHTLPRTWTPFSGAKCPRSTRSEFQRWHRHHGGQLYLCFQHPSNHQGLTKLGANTLTLTGSNRYTGVTTISGGTLQLGDGTAGHDGIALTGNIVNNAALVYNLNGNQSYSGTINGSGSVTKTGTGTLTLGADSAYSRSHGHQRRHAKAIVSAIAGGYGGLLCLQQPQ